jgi:hypothetical protein
MLPGPPEPPEPPEQPEPPESPEQPEREDARPQADADAGAADTGALPGPPTEAWSLPVPGGPAVGRDRPSVGQGGAAVGHPVARLLFSSGDVVDVDRVVLVGRAPDAGRARSGDGPHAEPLLVTVPSPQQGISSTHLEVRPGAGPDLGLAVVTDLGSTNGTLLIQPGVPPEDLKAGVGVPLVDGAVIDLGDGLTIRVLEP